MRSHACMPLLTDTHQIFVDIYVRVSDSLVRPKQLLATQLCRQSYSRNAIDDSVTHATNDTVIGALEGSDMTQINFPSAELTPC